MADTYTLVAEREGDRRQIAIFTSLDEIARLVDLAEECGKWTEGYDAVAVRGRDGAEYLYTGGGEWERMP